MKKLILLIAFVLVITVPIVAFGASYSYNGSCDYYRDTTKRSVSYLQSMVNNNSYLKLGGTNGPTTNCLSEIYVYTVSDGTNHFVNGVHYLNSGDTQQTVTPWSGDGFIRFTNIHTDKLYFDGHFVIG